MRKCVEEYLYCLLCFKDYSHNTIITYRHNLLRLINYLDTIPVPTFDKVSRKHLEAYIIELHNRGLSASSRAHAIKVIRSFFKYLKKDGKITINHATELESPKQNVRLPSVLSHEEIDQIFDSIEGKSFLSLRKKLIIELLYGSGLRCSELCDVKIHDISLDNMMVKVRGKGRKERLVPITNNFAKTYVEFIQKRRKKFPNEHSHFLFLNVTGKGRMHRTHVWDQVKSVIEKTEIKKRVSPHTFRHTFASHLLNGGAPLIVIQQLLGHSCISTTQIYLHLDIRDIQKSFDEYHPRN